MLWFGKKKGGKIIIRDCQSNDIYDLNSDIIRRESTNPYANRYMRTDNLEINWDEVRDAVRPRKRY